MSNHTLPPSSDTTNRIEAARALLEHVVKNPKAYGLRLVEGSGGTMALRELLEASHRAALEADSEQGWATLALALGIAEQVLLPATAADAPGTTARWFYLWDQLQGASPKAETRRRLDDLLKWGTFENHAQARDLFASAASVWSSRTDQPLEPVFEAELPPTHRFVPDLVPKLVPLDPKATQEEATEAHWETVVESEAETTTQKPMLRWQRLRQKQRWTFALAATLATTIFVTQFVTKSIGSGGGGTASVSAPPPVPVPPSPQELAEQFLDAPSHHDRIALLRDPRSAHAMRDHFDFVSAKGIEAERVALQPMPERFDNGLTYHPFLVQFADGRDRYLTVVDGSEGRYIDWDAYERTSTAGWQKLLDGEVRVAKVRVVVSPDDFYNRAFEDNEAYECLRLTSPDVEGALYGYVDFHSKEQKIIHDVFHRLRRDALMASKMSGAALGPEPVNSLRFTLAIRSVDGSHAHRQFHIERVVAGGWVESVAGDLQDTWIESEKNDHFDEIDLLVQNNVQEELRRRVSKLPARTMSY